MAPVSQEKEPPANSGRFISVIEDAVRQVVGMAGIERAIFLAGEHVDVKGHGRVLEH
jgi:hypothetical protein